MKSYKKLNRLINRYSDGYDVEYSLDEIRQMVDETYNNDTLTGDEYDELLELIDEIDEY